MTKAVDDISASSPQAKGDIRKFLAERNLSLPSLENQLRAQLAWGKVVQRKLRRNVTISQDEIVRAQQAKASAPDVVEVRVAALAIPLTAPEKEAEAGTLAATMLKELRAGAAMPAVATHYAGKAQFSAPSWMKQDDLPAVVATALRDLKPRIEMPEALRLRDATETIWRGETSMYWTSSGRTATASPSFDRQSTWSLRNLPVFGSTHRWRVIDAPVNIKSTALP